MELSEKDEQCICDILCSSLTYKYHKDGFRYLGSLFHCKPKDIKEIWQDIQDEREKENMTREIEWQKQRKEERERKRVEKLLKENEIETRNTT